MSKHVAATYSGYCPELEKQVSIQVDFGEVNLPRQMASQYKKTGYSCSHASENGCNSNGPNDEECPIFKSANL